MFNIFIQSNYKKVVYYIIQNWENLGFPHVDKSKIKVKLLPFRRSGLHSLLTFIMFFEDKPILVIKMPRYAEGKLAFSSLENESIFLDKLSKTEEVLTCIPQMYKLIKFEDMPVLLIKAYQGENLNSLLDKEEDELKLKKLLKEGASLLSKLYLASEKKEKTIDSGFVGDYFVKPLKNALQFYPKEILKTEQVLDGFFKYKNYHGKKIPFILLHHEFNPWNILCQNEGKPVVLDWEDAAFSGVPLLDLYNYFLICFRILFVGESKKSSERNFDAKQKRANILLGVYQEFIKEYCKTINISLDLVDFLFVLYVIDSISFFVNEKRKEIDYAKSWLRILNNLEFPDCFEKYVNHEVKLFKEHITK